jgi:flagellar basal body-associated protein FliL
MVCASMLASVASGGIRLVYLLLVILAVVLLLVGCGIAVYTLYNLRKDSLALVSMEQLDSENR